MEEIERIAQELSQHIIDQTEMVDHSVTVVAQVIANLAHYLADYTDPM